MKIETMTKTESVKTEKRVVKYTVSDIEALILADLKSKGYESNAVKFKTDYGYVNDEWGMNSHVTSWLRGAEAELETE